MKINFLLLENDFYSKEALKTYKQLGNVYFFSKNFKNYNKINVLLVRLSINLNEIFLKKFQQLKYIISPTTALNHIDLDYCKKQSIKIISLKNLKKSINKVSSTAELTISLMLALSRNIIKANNNAKGRGEWSRYPYISDNINSKLVGIIGMGRIGRMVAKYCNSLGSKVIYYDRKKIFINKKYEQTSLKFLLKNSDIVTIHIDYTEKNKNFLNASKIDMIKNNCIIINTARGEIIDEFYLLKQIKQNKIFGYACDVIANENNNKSVIKFLQYIKNIDNVIVTPHIGGFTKQSLNYTENLIASYFKNILNNEEKNSTKV